MSTTIEPPMTEQPEDVLEAERSAKPGPLAVVRGFGTVLGGSLLLDAVAVASVVSVARSVAMRRRPRADALLGLAGLAAYAGKARPWHTKWGSTPDERAMSLPGDELSEGCERTTRAITIDAPVDEVWPWIAQLGQDRGGFYSYEWLENLAGCRMRNAERIHAEWQHRDLGETVYLHPSGGLPVTLFEPGRALGLKGWGVLVLEPLEDGRTRLIVRGSGKRGLELLYGIALVEIPHFVMERKMLLGIKERAEAAQTGSG